MIFTIEVNNQTIRARKGATVLETLEENGIRVPTLCHMKNFSPTGSCRMCVVEVEGRSELIPSCSHPVEEWMKISTHSPRVIRARKTIVELLLANHPDDCLYCERNKNCELQNFSEELNIRERRFHGRKNRRAMDHSSPSITRDPEKCILCGRCVRVCEEQIGVNAIDFNGRGNASTIGAGMAQSLNLSSCITCGQCIMVCPTGALVEKNHLAEVIDMLHKPGMEVIAQLSQSVAVALGEEFGIKPGKDLGGLIVAALRKIGFEKVFETSFGCDLYLIDMAHRLKERLDQGGPFPLYTSDCPAWVLYAEKFHPGILPLITTTKSPQQITGSLIKNIYARSRELGKEQIYQVAIMPCTAKKFEAQREELTHQGISEVDAVLTTRELARFIRLNGIDIHSLEPESPDPPYQARTSSANLMGFSGGTGEAILRTFGHLFSDKSGEENPAGKGGKRSRQSEINYNGQKLELTVMAGLPELQRFLMDTEKGRPAGHLVEVTVCPGGCIGGGGQKTMPDEKSIRARTRSLQEADDGMVLNHAAKNSEALRLYDSLKKEDQEAFDQILKTRFLNREGYV